MKATADMTRAEIIAELNRLNPFGGYGSTKLETEVLRATLSRYRREPVTAVIEDEDE
jgi:hypothetical protein